MRGRQRIWESEGKKEETKTKWMDFLIKIHLSEKLILQDKILSPELQAIFHCFIICGLFAEVLMIKI